jgi:hypothetical protein
MRAEFGAFPMIVLGALFAILLLVLLMLVGDRERFLRRMRFFSKRAINPVVLRFAGSRHSPFAVIRHVGRRSGRVYETPLLVAPLQDGFVIEMTYGLEVDWYRNVVAAGECRLLWRGREYARNEFGPIDVKTALPTFPLLLRLPLQLFGAQHFVRMTTRSVPGEQS